MALVDLDVVDQQPCNGVGWRLLVFVQLGDQFSPVKLAATPNLNAGVRLIELNVPNAPGPAEQAAGVDVEVKPLEAGQRRAIHLGQLEAVHRHFQRERIKPDLLGAQAAGERVLADPGQQLLRQRVDQEEAEDQVQAEQAGDDQERQAQCNFDDASPHGCLPVQTPFSAKDAKEREECPSRFSFASLRGSIRLLHRLADHPE